MMIIDKRHLSLDILPDLLNQDTSTKKIIFIIWYKDAIKQSKINP